MTERTRFPLHTERAVDVSKWVAIGWTDSGPHPSLPGFHTLEWLRDEPPVAPFKPKAIIIAEDGPVFAIAGRVCQNEIGLAWDSETAA